MTTTERTELGLAKRVAAMRAELSEAEAWAAAGKPGASVMVRALKKDLGEQETKLAAMVGR